MVIMYGKKLKIAKDSLALHYIEVALKSLTEISLVGYFGENKLGQLTVPAFVKFEKSLEYMPARHKLKYLFIGYLSKTKATVTKLSIKYFLELKFNKSANFKPVILIFFLYERINYICYFSPYMSLTLHYMQSNAVNTDTEGAILSVRVNWASVLSGLNLEKM